MNRIALLCLTLCTVVAVNAQTQQGLVKTKGRLDSNGKVVKGKPLADATVAVKNGNAVKSGQNGTFALTVPGSNYYLKEVKKQGYVLTDKRD